MRSNGQNSQPRVPTKFMCSLCMVIVSNCWQWQEACSLEFHSMFSAWRADCPILSRITEGHRDRNMEWHTTQQKGSRTVRHKDRKAAFQKQAPNIHHAMARKLTITRVGLKTQYPSTLAKALNLSYCLHKNCVDLKPWSTSCTLSVHCTLYPTTWSGKSGPSTPCMTKAWSLINSYRRAANVGAAQVWGHRKPWFSSFVLEIWRQHRPQTGLFGACLGLKMGARVMGNW